MAITAFERIYNVALTVAQPGSDLAAHMIANAAEVRRALQHTLTPPAPTPAQSPSAQPCATADDRVQQSGGAGEERCECGHGPLHHAMMLNHSTPCFCFEDGERCDCGDYKPSTAGARTAPEPSAAQPTTIPSKAPSKDPPLFEAQSDGGGPEGLTREQIDAECTARITELSKLDRRCHHDTALQFFYKARSMAHDSSNYTDQQVRDKFEAARNILNGASK
jgi:hypothetical protein